MNSKKIIKISVTALFFALLAGVYFIEMNSTSRGDENSAIDEEKALKRYGFYLEEISEKIGVQFTYQAPKLDPKLEHIMPQVASVGASVSIADFNNDGWKDFYLTNSKARTQNALYQNKGDGTFEEVSKQMGIESNRWSLSASSADLTGNGYPDLIIANDYGVDELFINEEGKRFSEGGESAGMGFVPKSEMNVSYGDILNQGTFAVYVTNISEPGVLIQGNNLWVPEAGNDEVVSFQNLSGNLGIEIGGWSYGAQFGDLNNDGYLDLYVANGYVSAEQGSDYWYDFSKVAGGNRAMIADAENWPPMQG